MSVFDFLHLLLMFLVPAAYAGAGAACAGLPGGWCSGEFTPGDIAPAIAPILVGISAGAAMLFTVIGGMQMLLSFGDESKGEKGKMSIIYALAGFIVAMASQSIMAFVRIYAEPIASTNTPFVTGMASMVKAMVSVFNVMLFSVIIFAAFKILIGHGKSEEYNKAMSMLIWAIIGAIVVNVSHAIVSIVANMY